jgi:hypothetical protein
MNKNMFWAWVIWISIMIVVLGIGLSYIGTRLIGTMPWPRNVKTIGWIGLGVLFLIPFISMLLFRYVEGLGDFWAWAIYLVLGFISFIFTTLVLRDLILLGGKGVGFVLSVFQKTNASAVDSSRRDFLMQTTNFAVLGVAAALTAYGVYEARRKPGIVRLSIPVKNLPAAFEGFRIVQITDIHAGLTVKRDWVEMIAREVDDLKPDLIAFTGDLVDGSVAYLREHVAPLADLHAPCGRFFVTGNHEYYSGVEPWVEEVERMGYTVLLNEYRLVSRNGASIVLAGVTDYTGGDFLPHHHSDPKKAVEGAPADMVKVLLAHQPRSVYAADAVGYDLILSGHTHGGQFFPWNLVAALGQPYIKGLHNRNGTWVYVSKGTGYWGPPVRLGARSEITVLTLTAS